MIDGVFFHPGYTAWTGTERQRGTHDEKHFTLGFCAKRLKNKQKRNINLRITETPYLSKNMTLHVLLVLHQIEAAGDKQEKYVMEYLKVGM